MTIDPIPVPEYAPIYMTFDWGFGAPFSVGWWWVDADGRLIRFAEWYGWNGEINKGLRLEDSRIAEGIIVAIKEKNTGKNIDTREDKITEMEMELAAEDTIKKLLRENPVTRTTHEELPSGQW